MMGSFDVAPRRKPRFKLDLLRVKKQRDGEGCVKDWV